MVAERYITHENAHARPEDLNPKVNGPFLDDLNADRARARAEARNRDVYRTITPETIIREEVDFRAEDEARVQKALDDSKPKPVKKAAKKAPGKK